MLGFKGQGGRAFGTTSNVRRSIFIETKEWRSRDEKNPGHTRGWRNSRYRCSSKSDAGGRPMAPSPSWLSRRPNCRRPGGRGPHWRCARSTKALLQLCVRTRLFRADLSRPARKLLGRLALARAPRRGLLLTRAGSAVIPVKECLASAKAWLLCAVGRRVELVTSVSINSSSPG